MNARMPPIASDAIKPRWCGIFEGECFAPIKDEDDKEGKDDKNDAAKFSISILTVLTTIILL